MIVLSVSPITHTYTHTHACVHACTHAHTHARARTHTHTTNTHRGKQSVKHALDLDLRAQTHPRALAHTHTKLPHTPPCSTFIILENNSIETPPNTSKQSVVYSKKDICTTFPQYKEQTFCLHIRGLTTYQGYLMQLFNGVKTDLKIFT